jgi:hypothetical protein
MHRVTQAAATLAVALPLAAGIHRFPMLDLSGDHAAYDFGAAVLQQAPAGAVILTQQDTHTFTLWYFQYALDQRPDVIVVDLDLLEYEWYSVHLSRQLAAPWLADAASTGEEGQFQQLAATLNRPVCRMEPGRGQLSCAQP